MFAPIAWPREVSTSMTVAAFAKTAKRIVAMPEWERLLNNCEQLEPNCPKCGTPLYQSSRNDVICIVCTPVADLANRPKGEVWQKLRSKSNNQNSW